MTDLVDVRAEAIGPGEYICLGGAAILVTAVDRHDRTVDLHTCFGPALRFLCEELVPLLAAAEDFDAA